MVVVMVAMVGLDVMVVLVSRVGYHMEVNIYPVNLVVEVEMIA